MEKVFRDAVCDRPDRRNPSAFPVPSERCVGPVAVNLIGGHVDERRFRAGPAGGFQQIQGADGVSSKSIERNGRGAVVRRLRGGVNDQVGPQFVDQRQEPSRSRMSIAS